MGTSLNGLTPSATYEGLIKFGDNSALTSTLKALSDGAGNDTMLEISTTALQIGGTTGMYWDNTNKRLGVGTNTPSYGLDVSQNVNGNLFARLENTNAGGFGLLLKAGLGVGTYTMQWSNYLGSSGGRIYPDGVYIGQQSAPTARLQIKGSGSTSATTALLVQNSSGTTALTVKDNGELIATAGDVTLGSSSSSVTFNAGFNNRFIQNRLNFYQAATNIRGINSGGQGLIISKDTGLSDLYPTALLAIDSTTQGFLPPRMTTIQKNAISTPAAGLVVYDNTVNRASVYSTAWENVITEVNSSPNSVANIWSGSQAQYDALTPSASTLYFIV